MAQLRDPENGCPWDLQQTAKSLSHYILEEAYEVVEAIEQDQAAALSEELGDLLFQIVLQAQIAGESQQFDLQTVAAAIGEKLVRRHPHVFGDEKLDSAAQQTQRWEHFKRQERAQKSESGDSVLDAVTGTLPATTRAIKLQQRAASVGFDWKSITPIFDKVMEELEETRAEVEAQDRDRIEDEIGDLFFAVTNLARHAGIDPETSLRRSNRKFERRFRCLEQRLRERGMDITKASQDELEQLWQSVKQALEQGTN